MTGGLHSGELIILAARPSMGKTAFALNIAWHVATRLFQPVAIFSLEMSQESLLTRMLCAAARVDRRLPHRVPERAGAAEAAPGGRSYGGGATETRQGDHRPQLSDLRESGSIEQDADLVGFIFREEVYKRDREDLRGLAELILAKQRNGPIGKVDLVFLHAQTRFENRAEDLGDAPGE